jgi:serine/threonine protein kinase
MSPEQLRGRELDGRSDLFSFGAVLYEMATGGMPFDRTNSSEIISAILRDEPRPVWQLNSAVSPELQQWICRFAPDSCSTPSIPTGKDNTSCIPLDGLIF